MEIEIKCYWWRISTCSLMLCKQNLPMTVSPKLWLTYLRFDRGRPVWIHILEESNLGKKKRERKKCIMRKRRFNVRNKKQTDHGIYWEAHITLTASRRKARKLQGTCESKATLWSGYLVCLSLRLNACWMQMYCTCIQHVCPHKFKTSM